MSSYRDCDSRDSCDETSAERDRLRARNAELLAALEAVAPFMQTWLKKFQTNDEYVLEPGGSDGAHLTKAHAKHICAAIAKARE